MIATREFETYPVYVKTARSLSDKTSCSLITITVDDGCDCTLLTWTHPNLVSSTKALYTADTVLTFENSDFLQVPTAIKALDSDADLRVKRCYDTKFES